MPGYGIAENFVTECLFKVQTFFESICVKIQLDGCIKFTKYIYIYYLWSAVYQHKKQPLSKVSACWLVQATWSGATVTTITTILVCCKCKRQHRWLDIAITNMNAGPVQVYQTCMHVGTSLQIDATVEHVGNGRMQLLQTWLMVRCKRNIHGC